MMAGWIVAVLAVVVQTVGFVWWAASLTTRVNQLDTEVNHPEHGLRASRHKHANLLQGHDISLANMVEDVKEIKGDVKTLTKYLLQGGNGGTNPER